MPTQAECREQKEKKNKTIQTKKKSDRCGHYSIMNESKWQTNIVTSVGANVVFGITPKT